MPKPTHKVRSLGMWLKLETGMLLMLLLFSVLERRRRRSEGGETHALQACAASRLQDFERAQSPEGPLLDAADVVFVQLTEEKQSSGAESSLHPLSEPQTALRRRDNTTFQRSTHRFFSSVAPLKVLRGIAWMKFSLRSLKNKKRRDVDAPTLGAGPDPSPSVS